jgi:Protein of unknown function (DUF3515)
MTRRRPALRNVGAVACLVALTVAGCAQEEVSLGPRSLPPPDARACSRLVATLPATVADQQRRPVTADSPYAAAWAEDPPIALRCGVPAPDGFDDLSSCITVNGVDWFIPDDAMGQDDQDLVMTTVGRAQNVEVRLPRAYWPPATAMADLAPAVKESIKEVKPCL